MKAHSPGCSCDLCQKRVGKRPGGAPLPQAPATKAEIDDFRAKIVQIVNKDPRKAAILLTEWLKQDASKAAPRAVLRKKAG